MRIIRKKIVSTLSMPTLRLEGSLFLPDQLEKAALGRANYQSEADYRIPKGLKLKDEFSRAFQIASAQWKHFVSQQERQDLDAYQLTQRFVVELLQDALGYSLAQSQTVMLGERVYPVTHMASHHVPVIIAPYTVGLDDADERFAIAGSGTRKKSPFQLAQEFLNASQQHTWALVSNGKQIRLLRDSATLTRPSYVEFDIQDMLGGLRFAEFEACWRLLHVSRTYGGAAETSIWEMWRNDGQSEGTRVREGLREGVTQALLTLGEGFLQHPANEALRQALMDGKLSKDEYFRQLLRLVYRLIFLFTVEERGLLHPEDDSATALAARSAYAQGYALARWRERCLQRRARNRFDDIWTGIRIVFKGLAQGEPRLALPPLGGLFAQDQCPYLDTAVLSNANILEAISQLRWSNLSGNLAPVDYRNMGSEELGSVYESLLELVPYVDIPARHFGFVGLTTEGSSQGNARKTSGSYYTPDSLVQELIKSALEPVIEARLAANPTSPIDALLNIKVCDPACGSGHFLLAAARRLAERLAVFRALDGAVKPQDYRHALREVVAHCIYGVDLNPLAVELCKTALWLEAFESGKPLGFLDAHIRCGNALVGVHDLTLLKNGIPEKAYDALGEDNKQVCSQLKKANKQGQDVSMGDLFEQQITDDLPTFEDLNDLPEDTPEQIANKRQRWQGYQQSRTYREARLKEDLFAAAFFARKTPDTLHLIPTNEDLTRLRKGLAPRPQVHEYAGELAERYRFFHWPVEFPEVAKQGGFDVMLGNPPWERIKLQEQEFFATRHTLIATAQNKASRERYIKLLAQGRLAQSLHNESISQLPNVAELNLYEDFLQAKHEAEAASAYARHSGRFPLCGVGDVNLYAVFAEHFLNQINPQGRAGFIVPTGIATDDSTKAYFEAISQKNQLVALYSFENEEMIFPSVHHAMKFCLVLIGGKSVSIEKANFVHFARQAIYLGDERRCFSLTPEDFRLINPNTRTCPVFRSKQDAELTKKIYRNSPVLMREDDAENGNPWGVRFQAMFHMSADSNLFRLYHQLDSLQESYVPLYEAKMVHQFDHRWACYETDGESSRDVTLAEKQDAGFNARPRYWIAEWEVTQRITPMYKGIFAAINHRSVSEQLANESLCKALAEWLIGYIQVNKRIGEAQQWLKRISHKDLAAAVDKCQKADWARAAKNYTDMPLTEIEFEQLLAATDLWLLMNEWIARRRPRWLLGYRGITNATNERTILSAITSPIGMGNSAPCLLFENFQNIKKAFALQANLASLVLDYVARQKIGGTNFNIFIVKQLPVLPPSAYMSFDLDYIMPRVLELTYTTHDLKPFAEDLDYYGEPFAFDPDRRAILRAELDAYYATLYGLSRDELRYILDPADVMGADYPSETFRVLKNNDIKNYGEYRTGRLVLEAWDRLEQEKQAIVAASQRTFSDQSHIRSQEEAQLAAILLWSIKSQQRLPLGKINAIYQMVKNPNYAELFLAKSDYQELVALSKQYASVINAAAQANTTNLLSGLVLEDLITMTFQDGEAVYQYIPINCPDYLTMTSDLERFATFILEAMASQDNQKQQIGNVSSDANKLQIYKV